MATIYEPVTVGSTFVWQGQFLGDSGVPISNLNGYTVTIEFIDPTGASSGLLAATVTDNSNAIAKYTNLPALFNIAGTWTRRWKAVNGNTVLRADKISFLVEP